MNTLKTKNTSLLYCLVTTLMLASLIACVDNRPQIKETVESTKSNSFDFSQMLLLADTVLKDSKVLLWTNDSLRSRSQDVYIQWLALDGKPIENAELDYNVLMDMGMMSHTGPYYKLLDQGQGVYKAQIVFIMANMQGMGKGWMLNLNLPGEDSLHFPLNVVESKVARTIATGIQGDKRVFLSLLMPEEVKVGEQPIEFTLHEVSHNTFPALADYSIEVQPFMPDMGHGSENNQAGLSQGEGRYLGQVNLTMKGAWELKVDIFKKGEKVSKETLVFPVQVN